MKAFNLSGFLALCACAALEAQEASISPSAPWRASGGKAYIADYAPGGPGGSLNVSLPMAEEGAFYRVSWQMSASAGSSERVLAAKMSNGAGYGVWSYAASAGKGLCYAYVLMRSKAPFSASLYFNQGEPRSVEIGKMSVAKLSARDLEGNLLLDGDFESSGERPAGWTRRHKTKLSEISIAPNPEFLAGKRCMSVDFRKEEDGSLGGIESVRIPALPGREYEVRAWAKSEREFSFVLSAGAWSAFGHKGGHFYKSKEFKATPEWKLFSFRLNVPTDFEKYPDLADKTLNLSISAGKGESEARALFDNISFMPVQP